MGAGASQKIKIPISEKKLQYSIFNIQRKYSIFNIQYSIYNIQYPMPKEKIKDQRLIKYNNTIIK